MVVHRLLSMVARSDSSVCSSVGRITPPPALLTRTSRRPSVSSAAAIRSSATPGSWSSPTNPPAIAAFSYTRSRSSLLRVVAKTTAPSAISRVVIPSPIPDAAPVTTTVRPLNAPLTG